MRRSVAIVTMMSLAALAWGQGQARWLEREHDLGTFKEEDGKKSCTMRMVNDGDSTMVITRVQSTCGCTATSYTTTPINPGDTATVTLTYNPANRPGQFEKHVYVYTNGTPRRSQLTISGKVIAAPRTIDKQYPVAAGNLRFEVESVPLGTLMRGATRNAYINAYNASSDTLLVRVDGNRPHVGLNAAPDTVAPGSASAVVVHYDTRQAPLWGLNVDTLYVTSESLHNSPTAISGIAPIYVMAQVREDMSRLTDKEREQGPRLELDDDRLVYDNMPAGTVSHRVLTLYNRGRRTLNVRRLWCPDPAVTLGPVPATVKKGKKAQVEVYVDPSRLEGDVLNTSLTVMTDDPTAPLVQVRLAGMVKK